jgi:hypothetical protein
MSVYLSLDNNLSACFRLSRFLLVPTTILVGFGDPLEQIMKLSGATLWKPVSTGLGLPAERMILPDE